MAPPTSALRALFYVWLPYLCTPRAATAAAHALNPHSRAKTPRAAAAAAHAPPPHPRAKRNVLLIVADDLGYNELGFMNTSRGLHTPHLDFLASQGVALRNYYVQPICSPTRSSLMTGRYPLRIGTQANVIYWDTPWSIALNQTFLPQYLQRVESDYATALFGKWHLGAHADRFAPWNRGFDEHVGYLQGCGGGWTHISSCCQAGPRPTEDDGFICGAQHPKDFRGYDWFADRGQPDLSANGTRSAEIIRANAVRFLKATASSGKPFFLYLPFQNIHGPYDAPAIWKALYQNQSTRFTDDEMVMYGYLSEMDDVVGTIYRTLVNLDLYDDTLIVFTSDNGAPNAKQVRDRNWPLRGFKTQLWEGGTKVPAFLSGGVVPAARRGTVSKALLHVTDMLPTILSAVFHDDPPELPDSVDGIDFWEDVIVKGGDSSRNEMVYNINPLCESGQAGVPKAAIRVGMHKLMVYCYEVAGRAGGNKTGPVAPRDGLFKWPFGNKTTVLFDLESDPSETTDISSAKPNVVQALLARLKEVADQHMVEPMQWVKPYQGSSYECADCELRPAVNDPWAPWTPWID